MADGEDSTTNWQWRDRWRDVEVCFLGKGSPTLPAQRRARDAVGARRCAWLEQIHSSIVLDTGKPAVRDRTFDRAIGQGDALVSNDQDLALMVVTADCVPILLAGDRHVAAVHAGWRGIAADIVGATFEHLGVDRPKVAWIGPAISQASYEVGDEVASQVVAASSPDFVVAGERGKPHADLVAAAVEQCRRRGLADVRTVGLCTMNNPDSLWSYRRDGTAAGRNLSIISRH